MSDPTFIENAGFDQLVTTDEPQAPRATSVPLDTGAPPASLPVATPLTTSTPEAEALLEIIRRGLAPDADLAARAAARDICGRILQLSGPPTPPNPAPTVGDVAMPPPIASVPPLAAFVGTLRNLPPEQLLDLAIQRLRAALPKGAAIAEPKGVQFQLVPVAPIGGKP